MPDTGCWRPARAHAGVGPTGDADPLAPAPYPVGPYPQEVTVRPLRSPVVLATLGAVLVLLAACADQEPPTSQGTELAVAVASYDLAVGSDVRLMTGVFTPARELVLFGEVTFELGYLGEEPTGATELDQAVTARFLPVPGMEPEGDPGQATLVTSQDGAGVYAAPVAFDRAGFWGLRVTAALDDGSVRSGTVTFPVLDAPQVPTIGDPAPRTVNPTLADVEAGRIEAVALDSRAQGIDPRIPDQHLHRSTVADALDAGRPVVVMVSTPVYCVSRFCGPLTEIISQLALEYDDRADFVMIEVWEDFDAQELHPAAAEWIQTPTGGNEPWVFLVDADGRIAARWDNVLDVTELVAALDALPPHGG